MSRGACLILLGLAACIYDRPDLEPTRLADLPSLKLTFSANATKVWVEIAYHEHALGTCALLHESFRATVGETEMVESPGRNHGLEYVSCGYPGGKLDDPPAAQAMVLLDDSLEIRVDLGGRLARLLHLVPERPWSVEVGETVTARYAPANALTGARATLRLVPQVGPASEIPYTASTDEITFVVPDRVGTGKLELWFGDTGIPRPWTCSPASCQVVGTADPLLAQPIEIRPPASM